MGRVDSPLDSRPRAASTPKIPKRTLPACEEDSARNEKTGCNIHLNDIKDSQDSHTRGEALKNHDADKKLCAPKIQASFVLCCGFLAFGSSMAIIGPTVLELGCLIGADVGQMSWVFFAQTCSALFGAICSGVITDRFNIDYNVYLAIVMSIHAVALTILPFMRKLSTLLLLTSAHGLFGGFQDTATNLRMIIMHGQEVPPYLQTLFFFYGVGAFLSPIIAGNFLSDQCNQENGDISDFAFSRRRRHNGIGFSRWMKYHNELSFSTNNTDIEPATPIQDIIQIKSTRVHYSYFIVGFIHLFVTIGLWYLFVVERRRKLDSLDVSATESQSAQHSVSSETLNESVSRSERSEIDPTIRSQVICISFWIAFMVFISDGLQGSFGSYIYTYAVKSGIGISPDDAAYLNSLFWGSLALGRLLAIFVSMYVSPKIMLLVDITGCLASIIVMFVLRHKIISLWIGTATFGLCLSNIFPTSVSMAESYFRLTGTITCIFVVCSGLGEMAIPLLIGKLFDVIGPMSFLAISCILCFASVGIYVAVIITGRGLSQAQLDVNTSNENESIESPHEIKDKTAHESEQGTIDFSSGGALHSIPNKEIQKPTEDNNDMYDRAKYNNLNEGNNADVEKKS